jgi:hypothetical protein
VRLYIPFFFSDAILLAEHRLFRTSAADFKTRILDFAWLKGILEPEFWISQGLKGFYPTKVQGGVFSWLRLTGEA